MVVEAAVLEVAVAELTVVDAVAAANVDEEAPLTITLARCRFLSNMPQSFTRLTSQTRW